MFISHTRTHALLNTCSIFVNIDTLSDSDNQNDDGETANDFFHDIYFFFVTNDGKIP